MSVTDMKPPITVKVGGKDFQIRFSNGAFYLLSSWGIDVTTLIDSINTAFRENKYTAVMYKLAAAGLGTLSGGAWKTAGLDPLQLADMLQDGEAEPLLDAVWKEFTGKLGLATTKAATEPAQSDVTSGTGADSGPSAPVAAA